MFGPVRPTRFDLAFSLFGIPVRVLPWHWLMSVLMGWDFMHDPENGPVLLIIWVAIVFVSILVHEMGHALAANLFGYPPHILLYQFGGLTLFEPYRGYSTGKAIAITLAGPAAGFLLGMAVLVASFAVGIGFGWKLSGDVATAALGMALFINFFWTILNLMPVMPLDGGQVCREVCLALSPRSGMTVALWISIVVAVLIGGGALLLQDTFLGIMFLLLAAQNFQEYQARRY